MNKVEVKIKFGNLRIFINGILHLSFKIENFLGVQSYIKDNVYYIEYYFPDNIIETDYENIIIWKEILKQLSKLRIT